MESPVRPVRALWERRGVVEIAFLVGVLALSGWLATLFSRLPS